MKVLVLLATLLVSASAMFMNGGPQFAGLPNNANSNIVNGNGGVGGMSEMQLVMSLVRQILQNLLPKIRANPSLIPTIMAGLGGGKAAAPSPFTSMPGGGMPNMPNMGGNLQPPMGGGGGGGGAGNRMGGTPFGGMNPMMGMMAAANMMGAMRRPGPAPMMSSSDAMKDLRLMDLLRDPAVGLNRVPSISYYIPNGPAPFGWSLPDMAKDQIIYEINRRVSRRGGYTAKEREIVTLIGDAKELMPTVFGPRSTMRLLY